MQFRNTVLHGAYTSEVEVSFIFSKEKKKKVTVLCTGIQAVYSKELLEGLTTSPQLLK